MTATRRRWTRSFSSFHHRHSCTNRELETFGAAMSSDLTVCSSEVRFRRIISRFGGQTPFCTFRSHFNPPNSQPPWIRQRQQSCKQMRALPMLGRSGRWRGLFTICALRIYTHSCKSDGTPPQGGRGRASSAISEGMVPFRPHKSVGYRAADDSGCGRPACGP